MDEDGGEEPIEPHRPHVALDVLALRVEGAAAIRDQPSGTQRTRTIRPAPAGRPLASIS